MTIPLSSWAKVAVEEEKADRSVRVEETDRVWVRVRVWPLWWVWCWLREWPDEVDDGVWRYPPDLSGG